MANSIVDSTLKLLSRSLFVFDCQFDCVSTRWPKFGVEAEPLDAVRVR